MKIQYASDLHLEFAQCGANYWIYGHTHYAGGSGIKIGNTALLFNQLGYVLYNEHKAFDGKAVVEL